MPSSIAVGHRSATGVIYRCYVPEVGLVGIAGRVGSMFMLVGLAIGIDHFSTPFSVLPAARCMQANKDAFVQSWFVLQFEFSRLDPRLLHAGSRY